MIYKCVAGCDCKSFREHALGVSVAPSATPSRRSGNEVAESNKAEKTMVKNHAAYRRLKKEGLQPRSLKNVASIERYADDAREITEGKIIPKAKLRERDIVRDLAGEHGVGA